MYTTGNRYKRVPIFSHTSVAPEGEYYLENITENVNGEIYASIDIDYSNYQALRITQKVDTYEQAYTATTQATNETNNVSEVPCLFFTGLYPLSLHSAALYGKLLGEPFNILIDRIIPDGNTASKKKLQSIPILLINVIS